MTTNSDESLKTAIWLTSRSRMNAERRYRRYNQVSHLLLSWLSLSVIAWAVVRGSITQATGLDIYTAILSVFVFAFSVIIFGFHFGETAAQHRECYLRLQKLHDGEQDERELNRLYHEILGGYSNHNSWDFESLILNRTLYSKRKLWDKDGNEIAWTWPMLAKHIALWLSFWSTVLAMFLLGLGTYYLIATRLP